MKRISVAQRGDWSAFDAYLRDVSKLPVFTDEETQALGARACTGDVDAQEQLVTSHLGLVVRIAYHYAGFGLALADVIAEGNLALIRAAQLYNPKFGTKFSTYASVWVKQRIHRSITSQARVVRIPVWRSQRLRKLSLLNDQLSAELGRAATEDDLAERLGITPGQISELQGDRLEVVSLDAPANSAEPEGRQLGDTFTDDNAELPGVALGREELIEEIMACLHGLDDRELEILSLKHGFHPAGQLSFRELGRRLGVSHEWVRRIAELAVVKIRRAIDGQRGMPLDERRRLSGKVQKRLKRLAARTPAAVSA
ncbi:MAG: RNA polymerase sigma factor RpoD/SigA [Chthoniobacteraceae bacterium]